jgi:arylsulfatase A-like enzyme
VRLAGILGFSDSGSSGLGTDRQSYADQVSYLDSRLSETVDAILAAARRPPVIILMSDHGSRIGTAVVGPDTSDEGLDTFFAALTPGHPGLFGEEPTPLLVFDRLLSVYVGVASTP